MSLVVAHGLALPGRLEPVSLSVEAGTLTCLIGPNGSGKTSLLHGLARIGGAAGQVTVDGENVEASPPARRGRLLTYLPSTRELHWPLSARDLIGLSGASDVEAEAILERLDLAGLADRRADRLSTGERSRILISRALATRPRLLLLDEPTANLDPLWQIRFMEMVRGEVRDERRAAIVAMHDLDAAGRYADRLIVMDKGAIAADGLPEEVLTSPVIPRIFGIVGGPDGWRPAVTPSADR